MAKDYAHGDYEWRGRTLNGEKPGDMKKVDPSKYELAENKSKDHFQEELKKNIKPIPFIIFGILQIASFVALGIIATASLRQMVTPNTYVYFVPICYIAAFLLLATGIMSFIVVLFKKLIIMSALVILSFLTMCFCIWAFVLALGELVDYLTLYGHDYEYADLNFIQSSRIVACVFAFVGLGICVAIIVFGVLALTGWSKFTIKRKPPKPSYTEGAIYGGLLPGDTKGFKYTDGRENEGGRPLNPPKFKTKSKGQTNSGYDTGFESGGDSPPSYATKSHLLPPGQRYKSQNELTVPNNYSSRKYAPNDLSNDPAEGRQRSFDTPDSNIVVIHQKDKVETANRTQQAQAPAPSYEQPQGTRRWGGVGAANLIAARHGRPSTNDSMPDIEINSSRENSANEPSKRSNRWRQNRRQQDEYNEMLERW